MNQERRIWLLYSLKLSGEATPEELTELDTYMQHDAAIMNRFKLLEKVWNVKNESSVEKVNEAFDKHLQRLSTHLSEPILQYDDQLSQAGSKEISKRTNWTNHRKLWWASTVAASIMLCWLLLNTKEGSEPAVTAAANTICTKPGSKTNIKLPDGTKVWLNADSKLTYSANFQGATRVVHLSGEAFFDVVKDRARPFIIHTKTIDLKVLGTAFNVRSYANEKETETSLVHGSVEVTIKNNSDKKIILRPSEKLVVRNTGINDTTRFLSNAKIQDEESLIVLGKMHFIGNDSSSIETSWTKNQLGFNNEPLEQIASKIARWYNVKVVIADSKLNETKFTGIFEDESLEEVMEALRISGNFHYSFGKKEVVIRP